MLNYANEPFEPSYLRLLRSLLRKSTQEDPRADRTGTGRYSEFGLVMEHDLIAQGFPLLTTKKMSLKNIAAELLWFLSGSTNIRPLVEKGVHIWTDWPLARYIEEELGKDPKSYSRKEWRTAKKQFHTALLNHEEFAAKWGDVGPVYGRMWRRFGDLYGGPRAEHGAVHKDELPPAHKELGSVDQIGRLIEGLIHAPNSRRHVVSTWDPRVHGIASRFEDGDVALSPCHIGFECYVEAMTHEERARLAWESPAFQEAYQPQDDVEVPGQKDRERTLFDRFGVPRKKLSLAWRQRSIDVFLGLPYNMASYALLTGMLARRCGYAPGSVMLFGGDAHLYDNHIEAVKTQTRRTPTAEWSMEEDRLAISAPQVKFKTPPKQRLDDYRVEEISAREYDPLDAIRAPVAV